MLLFNAQLTEINQAWWRMQPTNATSGGCSPPFEKWLWRASTTHLCVCCRQCSKWQRLHLTSPYRFLRLLWAGLTSPVAPLTSQHIYGATERPCCLPKVSMWQNPRKGNQSHHILTVSTRTSSQPSLPSAVLPSFAWFYTTTRHHV